MKQAIRQSFFILALSAVLGTASYLARPHVVPSGASEHEIELAAAQELEGVLWVDARMDADYEAAHLEGASLLNEENWELGFASLLERWVPGNPIVVYCSSQSCLRSHHVAARLREDLGMEEIYSLQGGWEALREAGLVEGGER